MAAGFALDIDMSEALARAPDILSAARQDLDRAADRALAKTAQWLRTHSAREIGRELSIIQRPIRLRFKVYPIRGERETKLWIGLEPLAVHYLGTPRQTPSGVSVGRHDYEGAFVDPMKSRSPMVWQRKGKERLPIEKVTEDWQEAAQLVIQRWERRATTRFIEIFEQEARYVLSRD